MKLQTWLFIFLLVIVQAIFTLKSTHKIRLEEISESVRNVYWLQKRTIYDGISSNVGWYGTLLVLYNIFGFHLFEAKLYRLVCLMISLICVAKLLKDYLGEKNALVPLLAIGLSPTLIYFNTLQTSFGIDLQYFPICLYLLLSLDFLKPLKAVFKQITLWLLAMIACMSYPTFLAYLPILLIIYLLKILKQRKKISRWAFLNNSLVSLLSFIFPLGFIFIYLREPQLLIYDDHVKSGIFRGGGGSQMPRSFLVVWRNVVNGSKQIWKDLFFVPNSFYFEHDIIRSEFSHKLLVGIIIFLILISLWLFIKVRQARLFIGLSFLLLALSLLVGNFSGTLPGIRRSAGVLVALYALFCIAWKYKDQRYFLGSSILPFLISLSLGLIILHHLKVYPNNLLALKLTTPHAADGCLNKITDNPAKSLAYFVDKIRNGEKVNNFDYGKGDYVCRLHSLFAGVSGTCLWNHLDCPPMWAYDETKPGKTYIMVSTSLWEKYYFNH